LSIRWRWQHAPSLFSPYAVAAQVGGLWVSACRITVKPVNLEHPEAFSSPTACADKVGFQFRFRSAAVFQTGFSRAGLQSTGMLMTGAFA